MIRTKSWQSSIGCVLLTVGLQGIGWSVARSQSLPQPTSRGLTQHSSEQVLAQSGVPAAPSYQPVAPPPQTAPLPDERQFQEDQSINADYRVTALQADIDGNLWVGSWQGVAKIDPETGRILNRVSLPNATVGALAQDRMGRIWVGTYEGLIRLDPRTGKITAQNFTLPSNRILSLLIDQRGFLWVGTDHGLAMVSPDRGLLMTTVKDLPGVSANALTLDGRGNLWVGTLEGLVQVDTASAAPIRQVTDLPGTTVQVLTSKYQVIPVQIEQALRRQAEQAAARQRARTRKPATNRQVTRPTKPGKPRKPAQPLQKKPVAIKVPPPPGSIWVGTPNSLLELDAATGLVKQAPAALQGRNITDLQLDRFGQLWVGTFTGLVRVNPTNGTINGAITKLPSSRILSMAADTGGKLWVGTSEGLAWVSMQTFRTGNHQTFRRQ